MQVVECHHNGVTHAGFPAALQGFIGIWTANPAAAAISLQRQGNTSAIYACTTQFALVHSE